MGMVQNAATRIAAAVGIGGDSDLARQREAARAKFFDRTERDAKNKSVLQRVSEKERQITLGLAHPGERLPLEAELRATSFAVSESKSAEKFLMDSAPEDLRFAHEGFKRARFVARRRIVTLETDLRDARQRADNTAAALQKIEAAPVNVYPGDPFSSAQSAKERATDVAQAKRAAAAAAAAVAQLTLELEVARRDYGAAEDNLADSRRALIAA